MACVSAVRAGVGGAAPLRLLFTGGAGETTGTGTDRGEREALWTMLRPVIGAMDQGDELAFTAATEALDVHLAALERADPAAGATARRLVRTVQTAIEERLADVA
jgi:hypothetical protein